MNAAKKRLRPGELDGLVLAYPREHRGDASLTATAIAKGLGGRSAGAVANCLSRLTKEKKVRQETRGLLAPTSAGRHRRGDRMGESTGEGRRPPSPLPRIDTAEIAIFRGSGLSLGPWAASAPEKSPLREQGMRAVTQWLRMLGRIRERHER